MKVKAWGIAHIAADSGMTLVELMAVVLIIGILVLLATAVLTAPVFNTRNTACKANLRLIDGAVFQYRSEYDSLPPNIATLVGTGFIKSPPMDPHPSYSQYTIEDGLARSEDDHQVYP